MVPPPPWQEPGGLPASLPTRTPTSPEPDRDRSPTPAEPTGEQGMKHIPGLGQETALPRCNYYLTYFGWGLFASSKFSHSFPFSPVIAPCHLALHGEKSGPRLKSGLPSSLPYSSHTPIYCFPPGSHRNPCLWAWQEATMLLCWVFFNI